MSMKQHVYSAMIVGLVGLLISAFPNLRPHAQNPSAPVRLGPSIHFSHLTSDDGLLQNSIGAIAQDGRGFMWIGTVAGLSQYDGYRFTPYEHDPGDPKSLSASFIRTLYKDRNGTLWIGTEGGGVNKFDAHTETFIHYTSDPGAPNTIGGDRFTSIFHDSTGEYWFGGSGISDLTRFDPVQQTFTQYHRGSDQNDPYTFRGGNVGDIIETKGGQVWLIAETVLANFDLQSGQFTYYGFPIREETHAVAMRKDADGNLWIGGRQGLYKFDLQSHAFTYFNAVQTINDVLVDKTGAIWLGANNGLFRFDPTTGQVIDSYHHDSSQISSLSSDGVTVLFQDDSGVIWIGTRDAGLNLYDPHQAHFVHYRNDPGDPASLTKNAISSIWGADKGHVWVAGGNTLNLLDLSNGKTSAFSPKLENALGARITAVYQDRAGAVWVGMTNAQLLRFDTTTHEFTPYPLDAAGSPGPSASQSPPSGSGSQPSSAPAQQPPPANPAAMVSAIYEDAQSNLWVAVNLRGIYKIDSGRANAQFYKGPSLPPPPPPAKLPDNLPPMPIENLYGANDGSIWVSTVNGFRKFDPHTGNYEMYRAKTDEPGPDSLIETIHQDKNGILWVASQDGLFSVDVATQTSTRYTTQDGLPSNFVLGILEDRDGNIWVSTNKGLSKFTQKTKKFRNYDASDGLQANEFSAYAFWQADDGEMFFGGTNGLTAFYPDQVVDSAYHPPVVLTGLQIFNTKPDEYPPLNTILDANNLTLPHDQNGISFEFAALNFVSPAKIQYRYMLTGLDTGWTDTPSTRRFVSYTNLPAGDYVFRVQATNNDDVWSDQKAALNFTVLPPWWETTWFRAAFVLLVGGLLLGGYQWRVYAINQRNRLLEKEVAERTRSLEERTGQLQTSQEYLRHAKDAAEAANRAKSAFLANMSHELRSPLNAVLGFAQVIDRNQSLPTEVHTNLGIILRSGEHLLMLINQVLDLSKIEAGRMTPNEVDFNFYQFLQDLEDMFSLRAKDKDLQLVFERNANLPRYLHADDIKLRQILINLIGNALKFTNAGSVTVQIRKSLNSDTADPSLVELDFEIQDTGPGIAPDEMKDLFQAFSQTSTGRQAQEGTGLGLPISRRFVQMLGGDITVNSEVGHGTTFKFNVRCREIAAIASFERQDSTNQPRVIGLEPGQPRSRILVVDDKWVNRQVLVKLLSPLGFDLREAENGKEAVEISRVFEPHLVWMDWRMPEMDGLAAAQLIKSSPQGRETVIIILTASALEEDRATVLEAGCNDFVRKPFRAEDIFDHIKKHLGVRFVYGSNEAPVVAQTVNAKPNLNDLQSAIHKLPSDLVLRLTEGIELGDLEVIDDSIARISHVDPDLAKALNQFAYQFEYDTILTLLRKPTV